MSDVKVWKDKKLLANSKYRFFPASIMLRAIFSNRYFKSQNLKEGGSVLDVGTLYANNLIPFFDRGWDCYGTEVTEESVEIAKASSLKQKISSDIRLGFNTKLPFDNEQFDVLLSLGTIHYEETIEDVKLALKEFSRVLKRGGCALIETTAPKHHLFVKSKHIKEQLYQLDLPSDLRHKQFFTFFEDEAKFRKIASECFSSIEVARCTEQYPNTTIDIWIFKLSKT